MEKVIKVTAAQGHGQAVNCASVDGVRGVGNQSGCSASKHGVIGLTDMVEGSLRQRGGDNWEEIGALVSFLLPGRTVHINGSVLVIDGGQHAIF